jgi:hypothetical protein
MGNISFVSSHITEDIIWDIIGDKVVHGKKEYIAVLLERNKTPAKVLALSKIITHGHDASTNG